MENGQFAQYQIPKQVWLGANLSQPFVSCLSAIEHCGDVIKRRPSPLSEYHSDMRNPLERPLNPPKNLLAAKFACKEAVQLAHSFRH